jgi:uncharacterized iron-regulated membrane protein
MSDSHELHHDPQANEAVQAVVDRVLSWHEGAAVDTVRSELEKGLSEVGETMPEEWLLRTADRIHRADPIQGQRGHKEQADQA